MKLELRLLPGVFAVCRLAPDADVPGLLRHLTASPPVPAERFWSVTRTQDELSVICAGGRRPRRAPGPAGLARAPGRRAARLRADRVAAALTAPLAEAGVSVLPVATYDTDYLFVREEALAGRASGPRGAPGTQSAQTRNGRVLIR